MSTPSDNSRFSKYKPVKVNGVFVPELASYPVSVPHIPPATRPYQVSTIPILSTPSGTPPTDKF